MKQHLASNQTAVDSFQLQLNKTREFIESTRNGIESVVKEQQDKLTTSHKQLNDMFKDMFRKHGELEAQYEKFNDSLFSLQSTNKMIDDRTKEQGELITQLRIKVGNLIETKQDKSNFQEQKMQIQNDFDQIHKDQDIQLNKIKSMEHFIDKYIPIRVQQLIGETLTAVATQGQLTKLQNFEMEKYKKLNEDVLDDETHPELIDLMR